MPDVLLDLAAAEKQLNVDTAGDPGELQDYVDAVEWAVERHLNTVITPREFTEEAYLGLYYERPLHARSYTYGRALTVSNTPLLSLTSVARVDGSMSWDVAALHPDPAGVITVQSGPMLSGHLLVTYQAGTDPIPQNYKIAARIILQHLWQTQRGSMGGVRPGGMNTSLSTNTGTLAGFAIPNRALELLGGGLPGMA